MTSLSSLLSGVSFFGSMRQKYASTKFSRVWVDGCSNHKMTNIMTMLKVNQSPIAHSLFSTSMDPAVRE